MELEALQKAVGDIRSAGADLLTISPQQPVFNSKLIKEKNLTFDLISDPGNRVAKTYGLVHALPEDLKQVYLQFGIDLGKYNGDDSWTLPMPGRFIIDRSGIIRYAEVNPDYTVRPEPEEVIGVLKGLLS
ncbi:MAG: peroxiredoxin-like family protein [Desulfobacterales bacterium]